jgi:hypothetical protein
LQYCIERKVKRKTAEEISTMALEMFSAALSKASSWPDGGKAMEETAREVLIDRLLPMAEPTAKDRSELVRQLKTLRTVARTEFLNLAKTLPKNPGGRHKALPPEKVSRACADMATLLYQGVEKTDARNRIAARYDISPWTMGRYWREYQESMKKRK